MTPELESRLRACYPTGLLREVDASCCCFEWLDAAFPELLISLDAAGATITPFGYGVDIERVATAHITLQLASFEDWHAKSNEQKEKYLLKHGLWTQICISISIVVPAYKRWFNVISLAFPEMQQQKC